MIKVPVTSRIRRDGLGFKLNSEEYALEEALSLAGFMWFEYHWPDRQTCSANDERIEISMEVRQLSVGKAATYPKYVVFED